MTLVLYANPSKPWHSENVRWFKELMAEYPDIQFYNPNLSSPWHVKAVVNGTDMNFWPCAGKANVERDKAVFGYSAVKGLIETALNYAGDDFDVIEDDT